MPQYMKMIEDTLKLFRGRDSGLVEKQNRITSMRIQDPFRTYSLPHATALYWARQGEHFETQCSTVKPLPVNRNQGLVHSGSNDLFFFGEMIFCWRGTGCNSCWMGTHQPA